MNQTRKNADPISLTGRDLASTFDQHSRQQYQQKSRNPLFKVTDKSSRGNITAPQINIGKTLDPIRVPEIGISANLFPKSIMLNGGGGDRNRQNVLLSISPGTQNTEPHDNREISPRPESTKSKFNKNIHSSLKGASTQQYLPRSIIPEGGSCSAYTSKHQGPTLHAYGSVKNMGVYTNIDSPDYMVSHSVSNLNRGRNEIKKTDPEIQWEKYLLNYIDSIHAKIEKVKIKMKDNETGQESITLDLDNQISGLKNLILETESQIAKGTAESSLMDDNLEDLKKEEKNVQTVIDEVDKEKQEKLEVLEKIRKEEMIINDKCRVLESRIGDVKCMRKEHETDYLEYTDLYQQHFKLKKQLQLLGDGKSLEEVSSVTKAEEELKKLEMKLQNRNAEIENIKAELADASMKYECGSANYSGKDLASLHRYVRAHHKDQTSVLKSEYHDTIRKIDLYKFSIGFLRWRLPFMNEETSDFFDELRNIEEGVNQGDVFEQFRV